MVLHPIESRITKRTNNTLHWMDEGDFLKGAVYGAIVWGYAERFYALFQRNLTTEEMIEMQEVLVNRMREVKEKLSES